MKFSWLALSGFLAIAGPAVADVADEAGRHLQAGNHAAALEKLRRAGPFAREQVRERFLYATALAGTGDRAEATAQLEALIADHPQWPEPYNNLAALYAADGRLDKAKEVLERAMRTNPSYAAVYDNLSAVYVEMARSSYVKALRLKDVQNTPNLRVLNAMAGPAAPEVVLADARTTRAESSKNETVAESSKVAKTEATHAEAAKAEAARAEAARAEAARAEAARAEAAKAEAAKAEAAKAEAAKAEAARAEAARAEAARAASVPSASGDESIAATLSAWAKAWSSQQVEAYLGFYAADFDPPRGMSRTAWERERRTRLSRADAITVSLDDVQVLQRGDRATVRLVQRYASAGYADRTRKALDLRREDGRWRIVSERTVEVLR